MPGYGRCIARTSAKHHELPQRISVLGKPGVFAVDHRPSLPQGSRRSLTQTRSAQEVALEFADMRAAGVTAIAARHGAEARLAPVRTAQRYVLRSQLCRKRHYRSFRRRQ
jgi:hypothetical protein